MPEYRVETIVTDDAVPAVLAALKGAHPYEEPAYDLVRIIAAADGTAEA